VRAVPFEGAILWDIDGTLLNTAKAGRIALRAAVLDLCGVELDYGDLVTSGLTDSSVHASALSAAGIEPDPELVARISAEYVRRLPEALLLREGGVLTGIREALDALAARGRVVNLLLTGNTRDGAHAKLERYGLAELFPHGGSFCDGDTERGPIARRALELATALVDGGSVDKVLVIGDTPHDVACAAEVGLRTIGIATGTHTPEELRDAGAWRVFERIPAADRLEALVLDDSGAARPRQASCEAEQ
jgi:phosphoglycolate phosphatase